MANKMTKRDYFNKLMGMEVVKADADMVAFIQHEIELLDKKSASKGQSKGQKANVGVKADIVEVLKGISSGTATEIQNALKSFKEDYVEISNQKVSSLLRQLVSDGIVIRTEDKKKAIFSLAVDDAEIEE